MKVSFCMPLDNKKGEYFEKGEELSREVKRSKNRELPNGKSITTKEHDKN